MAQKVTSLMNESSLLYHILSFMEESISNASQTISHASGLIVIVTNSFSSDRLDIRGRKELIVEAIRITWTATSRW